MPSQRALCAALTLLAAASADGTVIRGVVVENFTSKPLARAHVTLQPVGGKPGGTRSGRANAHGSFVFAALPAGVYLVRATGVV